ncbi:hypothetical protein COCNU_scaffold002508G000050 [Cocos nucifera]|nr:hypothetical protein [Cocos nucifera]
MKFDCAHSLPNASEADLPLELIIEESPTKGHEVLPQVSQGGEIKFGISKATELPLELVVKEAPTKGHKVLPQEMSQKGGMKFGRAHDLPSASEAKLLELIIEEFPIKGHEVLP